MSNNINWSGNSVFNSSPSRQTPKPISAAIPTQQSSTQMVPAQQETPIVITPELTQQGPPPSSEKGYIPNYLARNIGKNVRAEFIIGSNMYADKTGLLIEVGINYFVLEDVNSRTHIMCDLYSVKFVTVLQS